MRVNRRALDFLRGREQMLGRNVARVWIMLILAVTAVQAAQVITSWGFAHDNDAVVLGTVLEVERLAAVPVDSGQDGSVRGFYKCRAQVAIREILKDSTGLLGGRKALSVVYDCGGWARSGRDSLVSVDAKGHSLFVAAVPACPLGSEGYRLTAGDSVLLGLTFEEGEFRPGPGGFLFGKEGVSVIREELARSDSVPGRHR